MICSIVTTGREVLELRTGYNSVDHIPPEPGKLCKNKRNIKFYGITALLWVQPYCTLSNKNFCLVSHKHQYAGSESTGICSGKKTEGKQFNRQRIYQQLLQRRKMQSVFHMSKKYHEYKLHERVVSGIFTKGY